MNIRKVLAQIAIAVGISVSFVAVPTTANAVMSCTFPATYDAVLDKCKAEYIPTVGNYINNAQFSVPANVSELTFILNGGRGQDWNPSLLGGAGASITATYAVTSGNTFTVSSTPTGGTAGANSYCYNGGSAYTTFAGYGGSYAKVALNTNPTGVFIVAGGGGGPGCGDTGGTYGGQGGAGGNAGLPAVGLTPAVAATAGGSYTTSPYNSTGGGAATLSAGGAGGVGDIHTGAAGASMTGGNDGCVCGRPAGGGGSGYFGGGAGGARGGAGGGGSSIVTGMTVTAASLSTNTLPTGTVTILYSVVTIPSAPGTLTVTPGNGSAQVSWAAVSGATSYTVTSTPSGATCTVTGTTANCTGLTNGVSYTFAATATNTAGTSSASASSAAVTPSAPVVTPPPAPAPLNPQIGGFTTSSIPAGTSGTLTLHGANFTPSTAVTVFPSSGTGIAVKSKAVTEEELQIDIPPLDPGVYDMEIKNEHGKVYWSNAFRVNRITTHYSAPANSRSFVLKSFVAGSAQLTPEQKKIISYLTGTSGITTVTCTGYTQGPVALAGDKQLALRRATNTCAAVKKILGTKLNYKIVGVTETSIGAAVRRVEVDFK